MCGIVGIVASDRLSPAERAAVPVMRDLLTHRGPDDAGRYFDLYAGLGHRRLAVIDAAGGRQPLSNENGRIWLLFNGEIYNHVDLRRSLESRGHRFASRCDAETVVHAYEEFGDDFLTHLRGMFALAVWDTTRRRLLLARDRLGVKPLYFRVEPRRILFASELKAIAAAPGVPRELDPTALADYLCFGFIPSPKTVYRGIEKLEPGECVLFENGRASRRTYWQLSQPAYRTESEESLRDELWHRLSQATADRLVADVPVGIFLSSGIDSAAVVTAAAAQRDAHTPSGLVTCTIGFAHGAHDERLIARRLAKRLETTHHEYESPLHGGSLLPRLACHLDEPLADPSALPLYLLSQSARPHCTVALTGDGGDEILAGYRRYRFDAAEQNVRKIAPAWLRRGLIGPLAGIYPDGPWLPRTLRARRTLTNIASDGATAHARSIARMDAAQARALIHPDRRAAIRDYDPFDHVRHAYRAFASDSHLARCQAVDIRLGLADGILAKADRVSMAHGLELRNPMLDHRFVEFAMSIPPALRIRGGQGKRLLRDALRARLGDDAPTTKRGFSVPLDDAFRSDTRAGLDRGLRNADGLLDAVALGAINADHAARRRDAGDVLWAAAMLGEWQRQMDLTLRDLAPPRSLRRMAASPISLETVGAGV